MKRSFLASAVLMFVFLAASAFADPGPVPIHAEINAPVGQIVSTDTILPGTDFTIDVYFNQRSGNKTSGLSFSFSFYSPDSLSGLTLRDIGGEKLGGALLLQNGFETGGFFDVVFVAEDMDGTFPDSIGFTYMKFGDTWTPDTLDIVYIQFGFSTPLGVQGSFCMDSVNYGIGNYDWIWQLEFQTPTFEGTDVGHCWMINDPTDAFDEHGNLIPDDWGLSQNYPNPFNPSTTIDFEIPYQSNVAITVYNVLGQKIKTLVDKEYVAGFYSETWDGDTDNGGPAASGIYFYKLEGDNFTNTRKMMLLK